ncbi:MAG TPA: MlrC C-terminal domain-containing protein, partial [Bordetella sp.]|nr:MlrC C-terminal domain-containing protein [Bordetella sp.]
NEQGPVILSEMSDAVGAGAAGDSAYVLQRFLATDAAATLLVQIVDPQAVAQARRGGVGAHVECRLGNHIETRHGEPVQFSGRVQSLLEDGSFTYRGGLMGGITATMGPAAVLRQGRVTVLATSRPTYEYADEQYLAAGIDVRQFKYVVVKNPMNYKQAYSWAPHRVALDTPGAGRADLRQLPWTRCRRPFYPLDDSPEPLWRDN